MMGYNDNYTYAISVYGENFVSVDYLHVVTTFPQKQNCRKFGKDYIIFPVNCVCKMTNVADLPLYCHRFYLRYRCKDGRDIVWTLHHVKCSVLYPEDPSTGNVVLSFMCDIAEKEINRNENR
jgi:hypothetical protein